MKDSTKDTIKGVALEAKGEIKEIFGRVIDRPDIVKEGEKEKAEGRIQRHADDTKQP